MIRRIRTAHISALAVAALVLTACAGDDPAGQRGTAQIVTTTIEATSAPAATTPSSETPPASTSDAPTTIAGVDPTTTTATITTTITTTTTTTTTTTVDPPPMVANPRVSSELFGVFDAPVDLVVRPGDEAAYIVEQSGRVRRVGDTDSVVADISDRTTARSERGLLGLAFSSDGRLAYLDYTDANGDTVVAEYPVAADGSFDVGAERVVLAIEQPFGNHNGGDLATGPDGMLYIAMGDGGSGGDPGRAASDPSSLLGSLLRIDPTPDGDRPYTIPADNPFAGGSFNGIAGAPETWAWGLRNPWKIDFDPVTGELWIADVGQNAIEEVNLAGPADGATAGRGLNFGWSAFEGNERFNADVPEADSVMPVLTYRHGDDGCSISGGTPYRGAAIEGLAPAYVYSDYCSGIVWALDLAGQRNLTVLDGFDQVSAVRSGPGGEIYVLELSGSVHRLVQG